MNVTGGQRERRPGRDADVADLAILEVRAVAGVLIEEPQPIASPLEQAVHRGQAAPGQGEGALVPRSPDGELRDLAWQLVLHGAVVFAERGDDIVTIEPGSTLRFGQWIGSGRRLGGAVPKGLTIGDSASAVNDVCRLAGALLDHDLQRAPRGRAAQEVATVSAKIAASGGHPDRTAPGRSTS